MVVKAFGGRVMVFWKKMVLVAFLLVMLFGSIAIGIILIGAIGIRMTEASYLALVFHMGGSFFIGVFFGVGLMAAGFNPRRG